MSLPLQHYATSTREKGQFLLETLYLIPTCYYSHFTMFNIHKMTIYKCGGSLLCDHQGHFWSFFKKKKDKSYFFGNWHTSCQFKMNLYVWSFLTGRCCHGTKWEETWPQLAVYSLQEEILKSSTSNLAAVYSSSNTEKHVSC